jgi:hypothetical protein
MRRSRDLQNTNTETLGWIDSLPAGGQAHIAPSVPTAAQLLAATDESRQTSRAA